MGHDLYQDARSFAALLRAEADSLAESAERIENAVSDGFTATEILMRDQISRRRTVAGR